MMKSSTTFWNSGAYTSPGTPDYEANNMGGVQKGWYSERVPLPLGSSKRHINAAVLSPFSSGRALPSKWDDADRWITSSPLSRNGACKPPVVRSQRRLKSKSGPLEDQVVSYSTFCSPAVPVLEGGGKNAMGFMAGSPLTTGVLVPDGLSIHCGGGIGVQVNPIYAENSVAQSGNATGWTDSLSDSSLPSSRDEKPDGTKDQEAMEPLVVSRRDMATQMSPEGSPNGRLSFMASPPSDLPTVDKHRSYYAKVEVRDVQVDKKVTQIKKSIKNGATTAKKYSPDIKRLASAWDVAEEEKKMSKFEREEARISAWESLQIAKAEAAIKKLEMKLEKKRSNSMDKILYKLRKSQAKAQNLRGLKSDNAANKAPKSKPKVVSFRRFMTMGSLTGCFTSHTKWEGDRG